MLQELSDINSIREQIIREWNQTQSTKVAGYIIKHNCEVTPYFSNKQSTLYKYICFDRLQSVVYFIGHSNWPVVIRINFI